MSLAVVTNEAGRLYIRPSPAPIRTLFFGTLEFVIDRYGNIRLRVPPIIREVHVAHEHSLEYAYASPTPSFQTEQSEDSSSTLAPEAHVSSLASQLGRYVGYNINRLAQPDFPLSRDGVHNLPAAGRS